ncbi:hypothetical protein SDC9_144343 [bioreactor metagenome]|uniref:Uncharacterized protein n=1 Tax=bioreactor metagenome TaxID=1076179 RepID=A0A645E5U7_9ZZZZ
MNNPFAVFWLDKMDIYRLAETETNGATVQVYPDTPTYSGVPCHYSKGSLTAVGDSGEPTLINKYTLFCGLDADAQEGDKAVITQSGGKSIIVTIGEGFPYSGHQEFAVKRREDA